MTAMSNRPSELVESINMSPNCKRHQFRRLTRSWNEKRFRGSIHPERVGWKYGQRWSKNRLWCAPVLSADDSFDDAQTRLLEATSKKRCSAGRCLLLCLSKQSAHELTKSGRSERNIFRTPNQTGTGSQQAQQIHSQLKIREVPVPVL